MTHVKILLVCVTLHFTYYMLKAFLQVNHWALWLLLPMVVYGIFVFLVSTWRAITFRDNFLKGLEYGIVKIKLSDDDEDNT